MRPIRIAVALNHMPESYRNILLKACNQCTAQGPTLPCSSQLAHTDYRSPRYLSKQPDYRLFTGAQTGPAPELLARGLHYQPKRIPIANSDNPRPTTSVHTASIQDAFRPQPRRQLYRRFQCGNNALSPTLLRRHGYQPTHSNNTNHLRHVFSQAQTHGS